MLLLRCHCDGGVSLACCCGNVVVMLACRCVKGLILKVWFTQFKGMFKRAVFKDFCPFLLRLISGIPIIKARLKACLRLV